MDTATAPDRPALASPIEDCLDLLDVGAGPERDRCRAVLASAGRAGRPCLDALTGWFTSLLGEVSFQSARAAFLLAGGAGRWPGELLGSRPGADFLTTLRRHLPTASPAELESEMPAQALGARTPAPSPGAAPRPFARPETAGRSQP